MARGALDLWCTLMLTSGEEFSVDSMSKNVTNRSCESWSQESKTHRSGLQRNATSGEILLERTCVTHANIENGCKNDDDDDVVDIYVYDKFLSVFKIHSQGFD